MTSRQHRLVGWALALIATISVVANQRDVGIARDEVVYMQNGTNYADWWYGLITFHHGAGTESITRTFGGRGATDNNREHPPLMKTLFGFSERIVHGKLGIAGEVTAYRLPSAIFEGILVLLAYFMVLELWGFAEAILAALLLLLLPRALFHAGLACFDAPIMTLWFATVYAYWRALDGRKWPWQVGVLFGLALATKHTAFFLPFALGVHYVVVALRAGGWRALIRHRWRVIVSLAVLGPLTLVGVWPWLWFDTIQHLREWLEFHMTHVHYNYEYLGHNWNAPRFPWHVALVTTLFTVPVATLVAAIVGAGVWIAQRASLRDRERAPVLLLVLSAAASLGPFVLGTTPIFGAEKHWMPVLPTICIAAAVGTMWAARGAVAYLETLRPIPARWSHACLALVAGMVVLAAGVETITAQPYALTWYNALAGGAPGGADLGMNRQFWGVAARGVLPVLVAEAPPPGSPPRPVYTHDATPAWGVYQRLGLLGPSRAQVPRSLGLLCAFLDRAVRDHRSGSLALATCGLLPPGLPDAGHEEDGVRASQLAIVIHERHFNRHDYLIWNSYKTVQPIFVLRSDGVPIVSVYRRPISPH